MPGRAPAMEAGAVNATMAAALADFQHLGPRVMSADPWVNECAGEGSSKLLSKATACCRLKMHSCTACERECNTPFSGQRKLEQTPLTR